MGVVAHEYVYGPVPPVALTVAVPSLLPKPLAVVVPETLRVMLVAGSPTTACAVVLQLFASVTVTV